MELYKNTHVRNYMDKWIVDEMYREFEGYSVVLEKVKNLTVLDIGANIGAFSKIALDNGAKKVISVEPEKDNISMLKLNTSQYDNVEIVKKAVSNTTGETIKLFVNEGSNKGLHTTKENWVTSDRIDHSVQEVETISLVDLLDVHKPEVLKIDIEGGEITIQDTVRKLKEICPSIKYIAIEFDTYNNDKNYIETLNCLTDSFTDLERNKFFCGKIK